MALYVVDGNNLEAYLAQAGLLRAADDVRLIAWLQRWLSGQRRKRGKHPRVLLVFDPGAAGKHLRSGAGLEVRVAPEGVTADEVIVKELKRLQGKKGKRQGAATMVTSDRALAEEAASLGVDVVDCAQFAERVEPLPRESQEDATATAKMEASRRLGRSLDGLFLPPKERGATRKMTPSRGRLSPRQVSQLRDPSRLADLLREGDRVIRRRALLALGHLKDESARKLAEQSLANDPVPSVRAAAAATLGRISDPRTLPLLAHATSDTFPLVRAAVAAALTAYDLAEARALLEQLRQDPSRRVRRAARAASGLGCDSVASESA